MPWIPLAVAGVGLVQSVVAGQKAKKAREELEKAQIPKAQPDGSVSRFYNEALRRYNTAPTATFAYKNAMQNIGRNQNQALSTLKDHRNLIGGVSSIIGRGNDASLNAAAMAERDQANRFGVLGNATGRKSADDRYLFNQNEMAPYTKNTTLAGMRAAANASTMNTGISNIYSGLSNYAMMKNSTYNDTGWKRGWSQARADGTVASTPGLSTIGIYGNPSTANQYEQAPT